MSTVWAPKEPGGSEECPIPASPNCTCFPPAHLSRTADGSDWGKEKWVQLRGEQWHIGRIGWEEALGHGEMLVLEHIA